VIYSETIADTSPNCGSIIVQDHRRATPRLLRPLGEPYPECYRCCRDA